MTFFAFFGEKLAGKRVTMWVPESTCELAEPIVAELVERWRKGVSTDDTIEHLTEIAWGLFATFAARENLVTAPDPKVRLSDDDHIADVA